MSVSRDGTFEKIISAKDLMNGLRPFSNTVRNSNYLITCQGLIQDNVSLRTLDDVVTINTSLLGCVFPYPQLFVCNKVIIVCTPISIYEYTNGELELKITTIAYHTWTLVEYYDFIFLSNGLKSIIRDPNDLVYSLTDSPITDCVCDFNGQVIISATV